MLGRYRKTLTALFAKVHELQAEPMTKRMLALEIQEELLRLTRPGNDRDQAQRLKSAYAAEEKRQDRQRTLISTLRAIGDAVAFIYGDRWDLKKMVGKEEAGFITGKRGTRLERKALRGVFAMGGTAVLNDLTHTLRHGDITVFRPDIWPPGKSKFLLLEMKSGRGGSRQRLNRQTVAIRELLEYLETDKRQTKAGEWRREALASEPKHHFEAVTRLAKTLSPGGCVREEVEPGLHYFLLDAGCDEDSYSSLLQLKIAKPELAQLVDVNNFKRLQCGYYPFPLCFNDPDVLYRFYNGSFVMFVLIEVSQINESIRQRGLHIRFSKKEDYPWEIVAIEGKLQDEPMFYVSCHLIGRLAAEFVQLDWLVENLVLAPAAMVPSEHSEVNPSG